MGVNTWGWGPKNRFIFPLFLFLSHELCCHKLALITVHLPRVELWPGGSEHLRVPAFSLHVGDGKQNQKSWAGVSLVPAAFLRCSFPLSHSSCTEPSLGFDWYYIHRHSNTCLPKVRPADWGILLPEQGNFACADNRHDKNAGIRFGWGERFSKLHSFPRTLRACYWV